MTSRAAPGRTGQPPRPPQDHPLTGADLLRAFAGASVWLQRNAPAIDAINVYPVPDGDTGANMAGTLGAALASVLDGAVSAGEVAGAVARAALLSARGNSGVILSQWLGGFADAVGSASRLDGRTAAAALTRASERAYAALREPAEGTILTVAREAAVAGQKSPARGPLAVFAAALAGAREALERTPQMLSVLREAGVVDAGGFGLVVLLEGLLAGLRGEDVPAQPHAAGAPDAAWLDAARSDAGGGHSGFGYCTQFVLHPAPEALETLRAALERLGDSVIVAPAADRVRVHVHARDPGGVLSLGAGMGALTQIAVENMQAQFERFAAPPAPPAPDADGAALPSQQTAVVAVLGGDGLANVARSLGASIIVAGGATANPTVDEILAAIRAAPSDNVIVLPNHKNVVLAAEQAAALSGKQVVVLPTRSAAQGLAVLAAFQAERPLAVNVEAMQTAQQAVRSIEVTRAARTTKLHGVEVPRGQPIALIDGRLAVAAATPGGALLAAIEQIAPPADAALTLYYGVGVSGRQRTAAARQIGARWPELDVQTIAGGQVHYDYVAALE
ncbi:MAG TPA: DAK2 domain-containing protein [Dehalococcoidia bacterium]|nr:DAK2 domain-containing protein [Dehalococcoidia bacterium]